MNKNQYLAVITLVAFFAVSLSPFASAASGPTLNPAPFNLPSVTYYINGGSSHYTITDSEWLNFFNDIIDNKTYVTYNWSQNATQDLIVFDLSYSGLNPYGMQLVYALSQIGFPDVHNFTLAFNKTASQESFVTGNGGKLTNLEALNAGAYPGFSWSTPKVHGIATEYRNIGIIAAIIAAMFILYFYFNRRK